jgi:endonuclease/exonuclease/phosphatase family metal-dependent hydrolase
MSLLSRFRRRRTEDLLVLESVPLHTERPEWAAHAPAQVEAALKRGAHVIGLTESRGPTLAEVKRRVAAHGYKWISAPLDAHRNVTLLVKGGLKVLDSGAIAVFNNYRVWVTFEFHGSKVTVFQMHWESTDKGHEVQTASLVAAMNLASKGSRLSFYMGDSNPHPRPQSRPDSQPNGRLRAAKMPVIYEELGHYPPNIGVNVIGRNLADKRVKAVKVETHDALGSDHIPATATYAIRRHR